MIKHQNGKWVLFSKDGSKKLGTFDTEKEAKKREKEIIAAQEAQKAMVELSLTITKATMLKDGTMRWQAVASTTEPDKRQEQTTLALFEDWIERAETGKSLDWLPEPRMPFLGLSHYSDLDGFGEAGITEKMYIDGNRFKPSGVFKADNELGPELFKAISTERALVQKGKTVEQPIRISAGWWDISHKHGDFVFERKSATDKCPMCMKGMPREFLKGQLDHFACTRVPVNEQTSIGLEEKSMATKVKDAASIISDDLAKKLDEKEKAKLTKKSETEDNPAMVIKAEPAKVEKFFGGATSIQEAEKFEEAREKTDRVWSNFDTFMMVVDNIMFDDEVPDKAVAINQAVKDFGDRVAALKANLSDAVMLKPVIKGDVIMSDEQKPVDVLQMAIDTGLQAENREAALGAIQPALETYVEVVKAEIDAKFPPDQTEQVTKAINDAFAPITEQLGLIVAKLNNQPQAQPVQKSLMPGQVSVAGPSEQMPVSPITGKPSSLTAMIRKSVGV